MLRKVYKAVSNPVLMAYMLRDKFDRNGLWARYKRLARMSRLGECFLLLSFDCDTVEDIKVVEGLHFRLLEMGVKPIYAVPGELLKKGQNVYRRIFEHGGEFINHGYREHTFFNYTQKAHASCFFYDQLSRKTVRNDILQGDACLREVLGVSPQGFRAPHFGTFQQAGQLRFLHSVLAECGYRFSTSTLPYYAFRYGPVFRDFGLAEIPVTGMGSAPLTILDSWGCFMAPHRELAPEDYLAQGIAAAKNYARAGAGILNYYADPSHIHNQKIFFRTVEYWLTVARPVTFGELLGEIPCNDKS